MTMNGEGKLAIFLPNLDGGGAERAMLNLAHGFADSGLRVDLVLAQARGPYLGSVQKSVRLIDLNSPRLIMSLPALSRYLRRERPQALLSALNHANVVALWAHRLAGAPCRIAVNEQNTITRSAPASSRRRQRFVPRLVRRFYPWADFIIGNSQGVAEDLIQFTGLERERITLLYNPVVTPELRQKAQEPLDHPWFEPGQPPVVLGVGRLTRQKDFPNLIQAFARVRKTRPARLMILGEGPDRQALEALVDQLGMEADVALPGFVENPYAYMSRASVFVLSSRWEGLPTVLIEALYCCPRVLAADCPSGPREILAGGKFGALVPVGDEASLSQAICAALTGETPQSTEESWHPYSLEAVVSQYTDLLLKNDAEEQAVERTRKPLLYIPQREA